jgi:hypothetical protein
LTADDSTSASPRVGLSIGAEEARSRPTGLVCETEGLPVRMIVDPGVEYETLSTKLNVFCEHTAHPPS